MQVLTAFNTIVTRSGLSKAAIAKSIGRNVNYINGITIRGSVPRADTLALVADVCGYDLALIKRDGSDTIIIDPPND